MQSYRNKITLFVKEENTFEEQDSNSISGAHKQLLRVRVTVCYIPPGGIIGAGFVHSPFLLVSAGADFS